MVNVAIVPSPRPLYQPSLHDGVGASSFLSSSFCHVSAKRFEPASPRLIETFSPSTLNGWPPACQIMLVVNPASPMSFAMYALGLAAWIFSAAVTYSSHVLGTATLYLSKTSLL